MEQEILELLRENNAMLKRICAWIDKRESNEYRDSEDIKQLCINVLANSLNRGNINEQIAYR